MQQPDFSLGAAVGAIRRQTVLEAAGVVRLALVGAIAALWPYVQTGLSRGLTLQPLQ